MRTYTRTPNAAKVSASTTKSSPKPRDASRPAVTPATEKPRLIAQNSSAYARGRSSGATTSATRAEEAGRYMSPKNPRSSEAAAIAAVDRAAPRSSRAAAAASVASSSVRRRPRWSASQPPIGWLGSDPTP